MILCNERRPCIKNSELLVALALYLLQCVSATLKKKKQSLKLGRILFTSFLYKKI